MGKNVYLNGQVVPVDKAQVNVTDRGFLFGDGLLESLRTYKQVPFMLKSHLNRLEESANALGIRIPSADNLKQAVYSVIESNNIAEGKLRITITRGNTENASLYEDIDQPTVLITISELNEESISIIQNGVKAISGDDNGSMVGKHKNLSMLASVVSFKKALDKGAFDMIQVTKRGFVTEGLRTNVFIVLDGILLTPPVSGRVLPGVTRQIAINIAQRNGIKVEEDAIMGQDLVSAEEIFLTNSIREIVPVTSIDNQPIKDSQVGSITNTIQKGYRLLVDNWLEKIFTSV